MTYLWWRCLARWAWLALRDCLASSRVSEAALFRAEISARNEEKRTLNGTWRELVPTNDRERRLLRTLLRASGRVVRPVQWAPIAKLGEVARKRAVNE